MFDSSIISIIIVSYNTKHLLSNCLKSVYTRLRMENLLGKSEVIVVDNNSKDGSVELIQKQFPNVKLIISKTNLGFAGANNLAVGSATSNYLMFLNSDTEIVSGTFQKLFKLLKLKETGAVGVKLLNTDGTVQSSAGFLPDFWKVFAWMLFIDDLPIVKKIINPYHIEDRVFYDTTTNIGWVSGACMMLKREIIDKTGLFDDMIFMYGEEVELCYRIKKLGYKVFYCSDFSVIHYKGASGEGKLSGTIPEFEFIKYFYRKYGSWYQQYLVRVLLRLGALLRLIIFGIIRGDKNKKSLYAKAFQLA